MTGGEAPLKDVLKEVLSELEDKGRKEGDIRLVWEKTAGKKAAKHTRPRLLKGKRLVVNVSDSSWLYKLTLEKKALMEKFNRNLGKAKKKIRALQFRIGDIGYAEESKEQ